MDEGLEILNQYLEIMKHYATEDVEQIPDGVYSIKRGPESGIYIMLQMPEELSGEVYWRFYPLGDLTRPITSPNEVLKLIQTNQEEMRLELAGDINPFSFLHKPLEVSVNQIGEAYLQAVASHTPDKFVTKVRRVLQRDDILEADDDLWKWFDSWTQQTLPSDALRRRSMADPVRTINRLKSNSDTATTTEALRKLREAIEAEGLDRPLERPYSVQPSAKDLKLVAWELVVGSDGFSR